jgi:hypothetical protein
MHRNYFRTIFLLRSGTLGVRIPVAEGDGVAPDAADWMGRGRERC